jgi:hypothetical protein
MFFLHIFLNQCFYYYFYTINYEQRIIPISGLIRMIVLSKKRINTTNQCGNIDPRYFSIETNHFTED